MNKTRVMQTCMASNLHQANLHINIYQRPPLHAAPLNSSVQTAMSAFPYYMNDERGPQCLKTEIKCEQCRRLTAWLVLLSGLTSVGTDPSSAHIHTVIFHLTL